MKQPAEGRDQLQPQHEGATGQQDAQDKQAVEEGEVAGFLAEMFIGQHHAEAVEDED